MSGFYHFISSNNPRDFYQEIWLKFSDYVAYVKKEGNKYRHYVFLIDKKHWASIPNPLHFNLCILGFSSQLISSMQYLKCSKEAATKRDPALVEPFNDFTEIHSSKLLEHRKLVGHHGSIVTALLEELLRAQRSINKLKAAQKSSKKNVEQFLQNLKEENVSWKHEQHQKIQATVDDLKDKLARERRSRERMQLLNAKLAHELAEANLCAKEFMTNYDKEKKERELMEEVCNELAMQIGENRAKLEVLLRDSSKICEEMQEERKMMQLAEIWLEERVQMKLTDAKLVLEDKYNQMVQLITYLQMFLKSRGAELGNTELEDAQLIKKAVESVNIQRIVELSYDFSKTNETCLMLEELRKSESAGEWSIKPYSHPTLTGPLSTIHIASLDEENKNSVLHQLNPSSDYNTGLKPTNFAETVGHVKDQKFSSPPGRRDTDLINISQGKNILGSEAKCSEKAMNMVCCISAGQTKWKDYPLSKLLRSCPSGGTTSSSIKTFQHKRLGEGNSRHRHKDFVAKQNPADVNYDECNRRGLSIGSAQSGRAITYRSKGSIEGGLRHLELLGQRKSRATMNPHITRGMKGYTEWPRGIPKANSKVIPLEERVRSKKSQIQNILKAKA